MPTPTPCKSCTSSFHSYKETTVGRSLGLPLDAEDKVGPWSVPSAFGCCLGLGGCRVLPPCHLNQLQTQEFPEASARSGSIEWGQTDGPTISRAACGAARGRGGLGGWTTMWRRQRPPCNVVALILSCYLELNHNGD